MVQAITVLLWILSALCFGIGAFIPAPPRINWQNAGLMFAAIAIAFNAAQ